MYTIQDTVTTSKCDEQGKLKLFSAFQMMQDCSEMWMSSEPFALEKFKEEKRAQLLVSRQVDVIRIPDFREKLSITTSIFECQEVFGFRNTIIRDEKGEPCYVTWSTGAFVDSQTGALKKLSQEILDSLHYDDRIEMEYLDRRIRLPKSGLDTEDCTPVVVCRNDIDYDHHVNNAHYIRMAMEYLPPCYEPRRIRVEWKKPARLGDTIFPKKATGDGVIYISLHDQTGAMYTMMEFRQ